MEPKNIKAILDWCKKNRPDVVNSVKSLVTNDGPLLLLTIGFEAGRQFQNDNPSAELNNPSIY